MYGPGQLEGGQGHGGKLNGEQFRKRRRKAYSYFGFQRWKSCAHSRVWARDFFILQITKEKESLISRCMVRTWAVLNWTSTTTWWEKAKWRWSQMKGNNRLRRDKMSYVCFWVAELVPRVPVIRMPFFAPLLEPTWGEDYSSIIWEVLKSTSWEENGFTYTLLMLGMRRDPLQFPWHRVILEQRGWVHHQH